MQKITGLGKSSRITTMSSEMGTPYAGYAGILLMMQGKWTIGKMNSSCLSYSFVINLPPLSISS